MYVANGLSVVALVNGSDAVFGNTEITSGVVAGISDVINIDRIDSENGASVTVTAASKTVAYSGLSVVVTQLVSVISVAVSSRGEAVVAAIVGTKPLVSVADIVLGSVEISVTSESVDISSIVVEGVTGTIFSLNEVSSVIVDRVVVSIAKGVASAVVPIKRGLAVKSVSTVDSVVEIGNTAVVEGVSSEDVVNIEEATVPSVKNAENAVLGVSLNIVLVTDNKGVVVVIFNDVVGTTVLKEVILTDLSVVVENVLEIAVHGVSLSVVFIIDVCNGVVVVNFNVEIAGLMEVVVTGVEVIKTLSVVSTVTFAVEVVRIDVGKNSFGNIVVLSDVVKNLVVIYVVEIAGISVVPELSVVVGISVII